VLRKFRKVGSLNPKIPSKSCIKIAKPFIIMSFAPPVTIILSVNSENATEKVKKPIVKILHSRDSRKLNGKFFDRGRKNFFNDLNREKIVFFFAFLLALRKVQ
jgi:hypothetical protein